MLYIILLDGQSYITLFHEQLSSSYPFVYVGKIKLLYVMLGFYIKNERNVMLYRKFNVGVL